LDSFSGFDFPKMPVDAAWRKTGEPELGQNMIHVTVRYDAYHRTFSLVYKQRGSLLDVDDAYEHGIQIMGDGPGELADLMANIEMKVSHA
jgi:hypothetical protein